MTRNEKMRKDIDKEIVHNRTTTKSGNNYAGDHIKAGGEKYAEKKEKRNSKRPARTEPMKTEEVR